MVTKKQYIEKYNKFYKDADLRPFNEYIRDKVLIDIFSKPEKVLDLAGGDGSVSEWLIKSVKCEVSLVDISEIALEKAKNRGVKNTFLVNLDEERLPFTDQSFDSVFWGDNIEHIFEPMPVLKEIYRVLKPKGRVVISFPNMGYWYYRYLYFKTGIPQFGDCSPNKPWSYEHIRCFNKSIISEMLSEGNFQVSKVYGVNDSSLILQIRLMKYFPGLFSSILIVVGQKV